MKRNYMSEEVFPILGRTWVLVYIETLLDLRFGLNIMNREFEQLYMSLKKSF